ncbi:hypothetical protein J1605_010175 [Eschrichtius robustus]|uniref:Uncharacterized protein n=1 Tax=Eschrichtius robustus TaxID=9764 RepID=A0AB34GU26_ESCRO|nr:hypothetical protein J1605_010175 [Eschrichtius robustus]
MWDLLGPGLEPVSPALAGGFLTTGPPGKSLSLQHRQYSSVDRKEDVNYTFQSRLDFKYPELSSHLMAGKRVASPPARVEKVPPGDKDWANSTDHLV